MSKYIYPIREIYQYAMQVRIAVVVKKFVIILWVNFLLCLLYSMCEIGGELSLLHLGSDP